VIEIGPNLSGLIKSSFEIIVVIVVLYFLLR